ncbi:MAG: DEAD/DEAH box helicase [Bacteroidaceae bacterium]|nr:DEAD/DEAH box helicase [Bacteroidaceae bacterium]
MNVPEMLRRLDIERLSPMQAQAAEAIQTHDNVILLAPTGTGKTLAFLLPLLQLIQPAVGMPQALVLSPTRELAEQTFSVLQRMKSPFAACCLHGGRPAMDEHRQMNASPPQIVVGTPGRVNDHLDKENLDARTIRLLIIDEYDKMLEMKFQDELERIVQRLSQVQRCILVSATRTHDIPPFMAFRHHRPVELDYLGHSQEDIPPAIHHYIVHSPSKDKLDTLRLLLSKLEDQQAVVFLGFRESVERTGHYLRQQGFSCSLFHGGMQQDDRERALYIFSSGAAQVLVSTDLSARGLDIPQLQNVVHYHLPAKREEYVHRCGRTGRWDNAGRSFMLLSPDEDSPSFQGIRFEEYPLLPPYPAPRPPQWATLYIGKGKRDKISRTDVLGFLCKQGGAKGEEIGRIDIRERHTYVAVRRTRCQQILAQCAGEKIKKMKTIVERMQS